MADELARLQDRVPPFASEIAMREIERGLRRPIDAVFSSFDREPVASASIAQVHFAVLKEGAHAGKEVAVKVLRPNMLQAIEKDLSLLDTAARLVEKLWRDGKRLRPRAVVTEFDRYLHDELDLMREAANASQLRRNFAGSPLFVVPEMYFDYCSDNVLVMQRMTGIPISRMDRLLEAGIDIQKLSRDGVTIFFMQVFDHAFFHADMHPGNILVGTEGEDFNKYIGLDFGIVGTLSESDKNYLAQNFLAFFQHDYKRVAELHIESGWVPEDTRVDELENAVRACCEPVFDKPLKDISLGPGVCCGCSRRRSALTSKCSRNWCCCRRRCSTSKASAASLIPSSTCGKPPSPFSSGGWKIRSAGVAWKNDSSVKRCSGPICCRSCPRLMHAALTRHHDDGELINEVRMLRREQRVTNIWYAVATALLAVVVAVGGWTVWRA